jgi:hypothetical protein
MKGLRASAGSISWRGRAAVLATSLLLSLVGCQEGFFGPQEPFVGPEDFNIPAPETPYSLLVLSDRPSAFWRFEERTGSVASDNSGFARWARYIEEPTLGSTVGDRLGRGITLGSTGDGVELDHAAWMNFASGFAVEAWVRPSRVTYPEPILVVDKGESWGLIIGADGRPGFARPVGPGRAIAAQPLIVGELYHLVGVYESGSIRIYVNGLLAGEDRTTGVPVPTSLPMHVGRGLSSPRFEYVGSLDEVAVYDHALTAERIRAHYEAGRSVAPAEPTQDTPYAQLVRSDRPAAFWRLEERSGSIAADNSGFGRSALYIGDPILGSLVGERLGRGITVTPTGDGVELEHAAWMNFASGFTVEAWVRPGRVTYAEPILVVDKGDSWGLIIGADGRPGFARPVGPGRAIAAQALLVGELYHLVGVYEPGSIRIYVNGALAGEDRTTGAPLQTNQKMHLGRGLSTPRFDYVGALDEVAIYDRVLSDVQIRAHYDAGR